MLETLKVRSRLGIIVLAAFVGFAVLATASIFHLRDTMMQDRQTKTRHLVEVAIGVVNAFHELEVQGKLSRDEAQARAADAVRRMRYEQDKEYFWINDMQPRMIMHPIRQDLQGSDLGDFKDKAGKLLYVEIVNIVKSQKAGFLDYMWARSKDAKPEPKISYVQGFEPWGWVIGTGIYIDDVETAFYGQIQTYALLLSAIFAAVILLSYFVARSVLRQLGGEPAYAVEIIRNVASGDLTVTVNTDSGNPASLLSSLANMLQSLRSMMQGVGNSAQQVTNESRAIAQTAHEVAMASNTQVDATSSMSAAIEEMTVSISHISENAQETEVNSTRAAELAQQGESSVTSASDEMSKIAGTVEQASSQIRELANRANEIASIASVITDIAAQTNLLALNAAIEAARAGEQGRGFAVVADEVRNLAERTAKATVQIDEMISIIQNDTKQAVTVMDDIAPQVQIGVDLARSAAALLRDIRTGAGETLVRIREVANATREQSSASNDIAIQVEQIAQMVESTSTSMAGTAQTADRLDRLAGELNNVVGRFRY
ncbi:methyl-accepting chemotaxis protein 4 [Sideroxyarcus emersonii]|uniref:Methyl-accepting chemotaxis protein 4 n=1 Tax=Sideroxyarcus emersonii TaxID=2764705 RepID=A0AAN1X958_9PROT|nr:methyl-accepting chemotaxis protein [Sideroxyarcus emersonii]BCK87073.1 methyl-accepting chemotaxis protein 4 [Sideroxyarcus emersonii]